MNPARDLRALIDELGLGAARLGVELDSYGLKAHHWRLIEAELAGRCTVADASALIDGLRSVKSPREIEYARRAAALADDAWDEAVRLARPGAFEGDILAAMQGAVFRGGGDYAGNEFIIGSGPGAVYNPLWVDPPMFHEDNPLEMQAGNAFFLHMIVMNSDTGRAMSLGHSVLVTDGGCECLSRSSLDLVVN